MAATVTGTWPNRARLGAPLVPIAYGVTALILVAATRGPESPFPTSYAQASTTAYIADLVAGLALLGGGALALSDPGSRRIGLLVAAAGVLWFAPDWEGWAGGPAALRSLGASAAPLLAAPLALLAVERSRTRILVRVAVVALGAVAAARALVRDPLFDPDCWRDCVSRTFVVHADSGLASDLDRVWQLTTVVLALLAGLAAISVRQIRQTWPVVVPAALAIAALAAYAIQLLGHRQENPLDSTYSALFYVRATALTALGVGVFIAFAAMRRHRAAVARLTDELGETPQPGRLGETLAATFGDPTLSVSYWIPRVGHFVDATGARVAPPLATDGRAVTPIVRGGNQVAVVEHNATLLGETFEHELGSAARLAVENERLQAEVRAQLHSLQESRLRITTRGDAERRRLERNLHDGAQQRLLALGYDLRLARAAAVQEGDNRLAAELDGALDEAHAALEELRRLAHGIYPAVLSEAGIIAALETMADEAPLAIEVDAASYDRLDPTVEGALYVAVNEAIADAAQRGATCVDVRIRGRVVLTIEDDGAPRTAPLVHVADRVGALGGQTSFGARTLTAEVQCE